MSRQSLNSVTRSVVLVLTAFAWLPAIAVAQAPDCNDNGVPDDIDLAGRMYWTDVSDDKIQRAVLDGTEPGLDAAATTSERSSAPAAMAPSVPSMCCRSLAMCVSSVLEERNRSTLRLDARLVNRYDHRV